MVANRADAENAELRTKKIYRCVLCVSAMNIGIGEGTDRSTGVHPWFHFPIAYHSPMADRSKYQEGVIRRYYQHFDTTSLQRLSEIVSEIYIAEANKPQKLWERAKALLARVAAEDPRVADIVNKKDIKGLARLVNELSAGLNDRKSGVHKSDLDESVIPHRTTQINQLAPHDNAGPGAALSCGAKPASPASSAEESPTPSNDPLSPDGLKRAMKAFRKRMKLTRLDDESKLGRMGNAMSGGKKSNVAAIMAPREFPKPVWEELVRQGKLKTNDGVFFELIEGV